MKRNKIELHWQMPRRQHWVTRGMEEVNAGANNKSVGQTVAAGATTDSALALVIVQGTACTLKSILHQLSLNN